MMNMNDRTAPCQVDNYGKVAIFYKHN